MERKKAEMTRNPLWSKSGYVMGQKELKELFASIKPGPPNFPAGADYEAKKRILLDDIERFRILSDTPLTWPEESSYNGKPI